MNSGCPRIVKRGHKKCKAEQGWFFRCLTLYGNRRQTLNITRVHATCIILVTVDKLQIKYISKLRHTITKLPKITSLAQHPNLWGLQPYHIIKQIFTESFSHL